MYVSKTNFVGKTILYKPAFRKNVAVFWFIVLSISVIAIFIKSVINIVTN